MPCSTPSDGLRTPWQQTHNGNQENEIMRVSNVSREVNGHQYCVSSEPLRSSNGSSLCNLSARPAGFSLHKNASADDSAFRLSKLFGLKHLKTHLIQLQLMTGDERSNIVFQSHVNSRFVSIIWVWDQDFGF